jgi:hypothetical protein
MPDIRLAQWKDNKRFAYSITYDEGLVETIGFAWRLHHQYGIPGHINVYPKQLGKLTGDLSAGFLQSLWNLQKFAEPEHLQFLLREGWSVGCQFKRDAPKTPADYLRQQREELEMAIAHPARCLAFNDATSAMELRDVADQAGFTWQLTLYDTLNDWDDPSSVIKRAPLYHLGPTPNHLANDPYRLLALARDHGAWVVDVVRLVDRYPQDSNRDCTPLELESRFKAVQKIGAGEVWVASAETVADYRALRLETRIRDVAVTHDQVACTFTASGSDLAQSLTVICDLDPAWQAPLARTSTGGTFPLRRTPNNSVWMFDCPVTGGTHVTISDFGVLN